MANMLYTPSKAERRKQCPWMSYLEQECGYVSLPTFGNVLGSACHRFVAGLHRPGHTWVPEYKHTSPRFAPKWIAAEWHAFWLDHLRKLKSPTIGYIPTKQIDDFMQRGLSLGPLHVQKYLEMERVMDIHPDKVEFAFHTTRIPGTSIHLDVRIDQIRPWRKDPREDVIVDLKFSKENNFDPRTNFALRCYALVYSIHYGKPPARTTIWNVPTGERKSARVTSDDLASTRYELANIGREIRRRSWDAPHPHCDSCVTKEMCTHPSASVELQTLARRNRDYHGPLPRRRIDIIRERLLELPDNGVPINRGSQTELELDVPRQ